MFVNCDHANRNLVLQSRNSILDSQDLTGELLRLARGDTGGDDGPGDVACTSESCLGWHEDVRYIL